MLHITVVQRIENSLIESMSTPEVDDDLTSLSNSTTNEQADKLWSKLKSKYEMTDLIHMPGVMHFLHKCTNGM